MTAASLPRVLFLAITDTPGDYMSFIMQNLVKSANDPTLSPAMSSTGLCLDDDAPADDKLRETLAEGNGFNVISVGGGIRRHVDWHRRVMDIIAESTSKDAAIVEPNAPREALPKALQALRAVGSK